METPPPDPAPRTFADFARPGGAGTLDQDNTINANLRDNGIGLVPRVLGIDEHARAATVGCGAIMAMMQIPLGWHIIDDGRRVLVFDSDSQVQVNFRLVDAGAEDSATLIEHVLAGLAPHAGDATWLTTELAGMKTLAIRGLPIASDDGQVLVDQVYMFKPVPGRPTTFCEIRTTTEMERLESAMDMVEIIQNSMRFAA